MKHKIPEDEVDNLLGAYWQLLAEVEARTDPEKDILDAYLVAGAYNVLNRCGISNRRPRWEKKND
jgi:hypothetical protein